MKIVFITKNLTLSLFAFLFFLMLLFFQWQPMTDYKLN